MTPLSMAPLFLFGFHVLRDIITIFIFLLQFHEFKYVPAYEKPKLTQIIHHRVTLFIKKKPQKT